MSLTDKMPEEWDKAMRLLDVAHGGLLPQAPAELRERRRGESRLVDLSAIGYYDGPVDGDAFAARHDRVGEV